MGAILQGTTPSLTIRISPYNFKVEDVVKLELAIKSGAALALHGLSDVIADTVKNTFTYNFTEAETLALTANVPMEHQWRFMFESGKIVGTKAMKINVLDLYSTTPMTEGA